jgi:hypothetical protein
MRHRVYRLVDVDGEQLDPLVGAEVEVDGEMPVEGFPSGDKPSPPPAVETPELPPLRVHSIKKVAEVCAPYLD